MELAAGSRLKRAVRAVEAIGVQRPTTDVTLECSGLPVIAPSEEAPPKILASADWSSGTAIGKRFVSESSGLEVLAVKGGESTLAVDGVALQLKGAKPVPSPN